MFTYSNIFLDNISTFSSTSEYPLDSSILEKRRRLYNYMIVLIKKHKKSIDKLLETIREFHKMNIITSVSLTIHPLKVLHISPVSPMDEFFMSVSTISSLIILLLTPIF